MCFFGIVYMRPFRFIKHTATVCCLSRVEKHERAAGLKVCLWTHEWEAIGPGSALPHQVAPCNNRPVMKRPRPDQSRDRADVYTRDSSIYYILILKNTFARLQIPRRANIWKLQESGCKMSGISRCVTSFSFWFSWVCLWPRLHMKPLIKSLSLL